jgi:hypothetical protein
VTGAKAQLANNPRIVIDATNPRFRNDASAIAGAILFETLNISKADDFKTIAKDATAGKMSRIDYVVAREKFEFDLIAEFNRIANDAVAKEATTGWKAAALLGLKGVAKFDKYLNAQIAAKHTYQLARLWNTRYANAWLAGPNKAVDPNTPFEKKAKAVIDTLEKTTVDKLIESPGFQVRLPQKP